MSKQDKAGIQLPFGRKFPVDTYKDEDAYEEMVVAKARLLKDYPFWGVLGLSLRLVEDESGYLPTLMVDGRHIFYNAEFVKSLKRGERVFGVAHEIYHCLHDHAGSASRGIGYTDIDMEAIKKDPKKLAEAQKKMNFWNFAADFVVNDDLVQANIGEFIRTIQILHDEKYRGWSVEDVYDHLMQNPDQAPQNGQTLDVHVEIEIEEDGEGEGEGKGEGDGEEGEGNAQQDSNGNIKIKMKRSEAEKLQREWQDNIVSAAAAQKEAEQRGDCAGCIPAGIQRLIDELTEPKINWKQALQRFVMRVMSRGYSFARPNKVLFSKGWTIPGFRTQKNELDVAIAVDTSGSISEQELTAFLSEMQGIMKSFDRYNIKAWCFDGDVIEETVTHITKRNGRWDDIKKFIKHVRGGGGTIFTANWEWMRNNKIKPRLLLVLTDGMPFGEWGWPNYCPTMFMIIGNPRVTAPFGMTIHYDE